MSSGLHRLDSGDPGYASNAWQATPNVVSGDDFIHSWSLVGGKLRKTFIWNGGDGDDTVDFYFFGQKSSQRRGILRRLQRRRSGRGPESADLYGDGLIGVVAACGLGLSLTLDTNRRWG